MSPTHIRFGIQALAADNVTLNNHWFIRARLKTRQLLLLLALEDEGNINRAAQVLSITQPAASKLLKGIINYRNSMG